MLRHTYVREGKPYPDEIETRIVHIASRDDDTGLDIWWWDFPAGGDDDA